MHAAKLLEDIGFRMRNDQEPDLAELLAEMENKVHDTFTSDNRCYALVAELKSLAYTGQALYDEVNGNAGHDILNWKWWHNKCLSPFLETLSFRLREVAEEFNVICFREWDLEPLKPHVPTVEEIHKRRQRDFDVSKYMLEQVAEKFPTIQDELMATLEKMKPEEMEPGEAKAEPEPAD